MRIVQATLEHLDLLAPLFVKYREFYGMLSYPESSRKFLEKRLRRKESVIYLALADEEDRLLGFCQLYRASPRCRSSASGSSTTSTSPKRRAGNWSPTTCCNTPSRWPGKPMRCACVSLPASTTR